MKKILSIALISVAATVLLASCSRRDYYDDNYKESGEVVYYSKIGSPYSIIQMYNDGQYAIVKSMENDSYYWPEENDVIYGNFNSIGTRTFRNRTAGFDIRLRVLDFMRSYTNAVYALEDYEDADGYYSKGANKTIQLNVQRSRASVK
ncbi:MAG: hypothetical protein QM727_13010 [Niabella sp.]